MCACVTGFSPGKAVGGADKRGIDNLYTETIFGEVLRAKYVLRHASYYSVVVVCLLRTKHAAC